LTLPLFPFGPENCSLPEQPCPETQVLCRLFVDVLPFGPVTWFVEEQELLPGGQLPCKVCVDVWPLGPVICLCISSAEDTVAMPNTTVMMAIAAVVLSIISSPCIHPLRKMTDVGEA